MKYNSALFRTSGQANKCVDVFIKDNWTETKTSVLTGSDHKYNILLQGKYACSLKSVYTWFY